LIHPSFFNLEKMVQKSCTFDKKNTAEKIFLNSWVIPRQLDQAMTLMVTDLSDYFLTINFNQLQENVSYQF
jgi:hypothetical protein